MKVLSVIILLFLSIYQGYADDVDRSVASRVAINFWKTHESLFLSNKSEDPIITDQYIHNINGKTIYYIFEINSCGFVIVSAENTTIPVLGYSFSNLFPHCSLPENIDGWIKSYEQQILYAKSYGLKQHLVIKDYWDRFIIPEHHQELYVSEGDLVQPLLFSSWHQGYPYNLHCPDGPGGQAYAGCVAIAMAQVMYYYRYPENGQGSHSYESTTYGTISADFQNTTYRWNEMVNCIYHYNNDALAELVFHCGVSVDMNYSVNGSGAYTQDCADALIDYFKYSSNIQYIMKTNPSINFTDSLKHSLDKGYPILYRGGSFPGHSFVCDGYQGDDYFHFNFGWGGSWDGYFYIDNITPGGINLSSQQAAIINIVPGQDYPVYCQYIDTLRAIAGTFEDGSGHQDYMENADCYWLIAPDEPDIISIMLSFDSFMTEEEHDWLTIYDGPTIGDPLLGRFSGSSLPGTLSSSGNSILVHFQSDGQQNAKGWFISFIGTKGPFCNAGTTFSSTEGWINDGSGPYDYTNQTECLWYIDPYDPAFDSIMAIELTFLSFDTEPDFDFVTIYDGPGMEYPILGSYSGQELPPFTLSGSNKILIRFSTDEANTRPGWQLKYNCVFPEYCNDTTFLTAPEGCFSDGSGLKKYHNNAQCYWWIEPPFADSITLTFTHFELEYGYDRLKVYDPTTQPITLLGDFTSTQIPPPVTSPGGIMLIWFNSDESITKDGWEAYYSTSNLSVKENEIEMFIELFPNPAQRNMNIFFTGHDEGQFKCNIYSTGGQLVFSKTAWYTTGKNLISADISAIPTGLYIIQVVTKNHVCQRKFIIKNR
ncbi:MAG: C10 family peptidase [Bacteroidetes bacterium]|nr:C10 family peptidase [Bacteroidota bacterium]